MEFSDSKKKGKKDERPNHVSFHYYPAKDIGVWVSICIDPEVSKCKSINKHY